MITKGEPCAKCGNTEFEFWIERRENSDKTDAYLRCTKCKLATKLLDITVESMEISVPDDNTIVVEDLKCDFVPDKIDPHKET